MISVITSHVKLNAQSVFKLGNGDNSASEFALGPNNFKKFVYEDFGYEDKYFVVNSSDLKTHFPGVLPGPTDTWGGTWGTSGWRTHDINILFGINDIKENKELTLEIDILDSSPTDAPLLKINVNDIYSKNFELKLGGSEESLNGDFSKAKSQKIVLTIPTEVIKRGGNIINLNTIRGSWMIFDKLGLKGSNDIILEVPTTTFIRDVKAADYLIDGGKSQALLIDIEHLKGDPTLSVTLDNREIFTTQVEDGRYIFEAPMPAVENEKVSSYKILVDNKVIREGSVTRAPHRLQTPADYIDTRIGTAHSRWMIAPGPWMPFSMVKMSPDNQNSGWQAGYQYSFESVGCFSHIHEWTMAGLGMMPTNGKLITFVGDEQDPDSGYRSRINLASEEAPIGYYSVQLEDYDIKAEITATTRCSFQRYTYPEDRDNSRVIIDLKIPSEYDYILPEVNFVKVNDYRIEGFSHQFGARVWSNDANQDFKLHFVIEFDQPITKFGGWLDDRLNVKPRNNTIHGEDLKDAGLYVEFDTKSNHSVQVRSGISLVSVENAAENLETEISTPFGWSFEQVRQNQLDTWNDIFNRVKITTHDRSEKIRFYNNMYRAVCSRNIWSDVNGDWISADEKKQTMADPKNDVALGCDAFWNTFWNLNQFWNLVVPKWSGRWVRSQLAMYDADGWLAKGPAGMEYIPVMVAEHEIPLIIGAYQMGIRDFDHEKAFEACKKMLTTPGQVVAGGFARNRDLEPFLKYGYVPMDKGRFSNSMEYAYDNWTLGQFAKALGKEGEYKLFNERGSWWRNVINPENGFCHLKTSDGKWVEPFDPITSHANHHYVEGNAWQLSLFVPQDMEGLSKIIGKKAFAERLDSGFVNSDGVRFNAPNDQYWNYPIAQGNQQTMHAAFIFNYAGKPWLTQKWSRDVMDRYYGWGRANAYLGDEDQGQMSAWFIMASIGLFQMDGGCSIDPTYEISSPLYEKIEIDLGGRYSRGEKFTIRAIGTSRENKYIQSATLNGKRLNSFRFPASELLNGGELVLKMGKTPNKRWGN